MNYGLVSVLPPLLAIGLAIWSRQVLLSLAAGIWLGYTILANWNPLAGLADAINGAIAVLGDAGNGRVIIFTFLIGALIATVQANGGMAGFVRWIEEARWVTDGRRSRIMAWIVGLVIFIESNLTILVAGSVSRPLFDRFKVSREKLAYIIDSTSAPVCILIPVNAWGAMVLGILAAEGVENPIGVFVGSIPLNFYALAALVLAAAVAFRGWEWGPMKKAGDRTRGGELMWEGSTAFADPDEIGPPPEEGARLRPVNMLLPIVLMVVAMPVFMIITGSGSMAEGSGSTSVLWAVMLGLAVAWAMTLAQRGMSLDQLSRIGLKGAGGLTAMAVVLWLALSLGDVTRALGTGAYVAGAVGDAVTPAALLPLLFVVSSAIAFATGSSWGTFAIMLPLGVPLAFGLDLPSAPFVAAVLSGGIFGDHCSPISDTTIISSLASATDHIEHVRTQIPYAVVAGGVAAVAFALTGAFI